MYMVLRYIPCDINCHTIYTVNSLYYILSVAGSLNLKQISSNRTSTVAESESEMKEARSLRLNMKTVNLDLTKR